MMLDKEDVIYGWFHILYSNGTTIKDPDMRGTRRVELSFTVGLKRTKSRGVCCNV